MTIRPFIFEDIPAIVPVLMRGFHTTVSLERILHWILELQPDGFWVAEVDGAIVGMVGATRNGEAAYAAMMVVEPALQRRGIGAALMEALMSDLRRHSVRTVMLDATNEALALYCRFGFEAISRTHDFRNSMPREIVQTAAAALPADFERIVALDAESFGVERRRALAHMLAQPNSCAIVKLDGCIVVQENVLGPWVARTPETAEELLDEAIAWTGTKAGRLMVPAENAAAVEMLRARGFQIAQTATHMRCGPLLAKRNRALTYGQASFALG